MPTFDQQIAEALTPLLDAAETGNEERREPLRKVIHQELLRLLSECHAPVTNVTLDVTDDFVDDVAAKSRELPEKQFEAWWSRKWMTDLSAELLAFLVQNSPEYRNPAMEVLKGHIEQIARRVSRFRKRDAEFVDDASGFIYERLGKYDPNQRFKPWCRKVLQNCRYTEFRRRGHRKAAEAGPAASAGAGNKGSDEIVRSHRLSEFPKRQRPGSILSLDTVIADSIPCADDPVSDPPEPLAEEDISLLESMPPKRRIICVATAGIWERIPVSRQRKWLDEADIGPPFPPAEMLYEDEIPRRYAILAEALGMTNAAARQHWHRGVPVLKQLRYIRQLRNESHD